MYNLSDPRFWDIGGWVCLVVGWMALITEYRPVVQLVLFFMAAMLFIVSMLLERMHD